MKLEFISKKVVQIELEVKNIREEMKNFMKIQDFHAVMDPAVTILKKLDSERIFTQSWIKRIENTTNRHEREIIKLKHNLKSIT